jgi:hypothetical protein
MRDDLLTAIAGEKDVTNVIILTHNIDFIFLQAMVLSALRRCGNPSLTVFADSVCAAQSYAEQRPLLDGLGSRYRVVPVRMEPGFAFHPKAVLLSGPNRSVLYVGSGNLTFGGWRGNAEVWSCYSGADDGLTVFREFRAYLDRVLLRVPLPGAVEAELNDAFDTKKNWLMSSVVGEPSLIGRLGGDEPPLLDALVTALSPSNGETLYVCAPYFDADGEALESLWGRLSPQRSILLHPAEGTTLTADAWNRNSAHFERRPSESFHESADGTQRSAFIHGKFYATVRGTEAVIVLGSANCSRAALTMEGRRGNAELMSVIRTSAENFRKSWLDPLHPVAGSAGLPDYIPPEEPFPGETLTQLRVLAARFDEGVILVGYEPQSAVIKGCTINGVSVAISLSDAGTLSIRYVGTPKVLQLVAIIAGSEIAADPHWVDDERSLRTTARGRTFEDTIRRHVGGERWGCGVWIELLQAFGNHLAYTPVRTDQRFAAYAGVSADGPPAHRDFEAIFTEFCSANALSDAIKDRLPLDGTRQGSIQKLLLRWLGVGQVSDEERSNAARESGGDRRDEAEQGGGDQPETFPEKTRPVTSDTAPERDANKLRRVLQEVESAIVASSFLESRPADLLAIDMKMISALLRIAFRERWIDSKEFFDVTQRIWAALFLTSERDPRAGWLEVRYRESSDQGSFVAALRGPQVSAALIAWMMVGADASPSIQKARFVLSQAVAAARLPWLWYGGEISDIAGELAVLVSEKEAAAQAARWGNAWSDILAQGIALRKLEEILSMETQAIVRSMVTDTEVRAGDLLWQGTAGFCVAGASGRRDTEQNIDVLKLQSGMSTSTFLSSYIVPVRSLLTTDKVAQLLNEGERETLVSIVNAVSKNCAFG